MTDRTWCMVCHESSSSEIQISISNEMKTSSNSPVCACHCDGLTSFHLIQLENSTRNAPKLVFSSSKIEKFSGEGAQRLPQIPPSLGRGTQQSPPLAQTVFFAVSLHVKGSVWKKVISNQCHQCHYVSMRDVKIRDELELIVKWEHVSKQMKVKELVFQQATVHVTVYIVQAQLGTVERLKYVKLSDITVSIDSTVVFL